jgi:Rap1a immunity proteins
MAVQSVGGHELRRLGGPTRVGFPVTVISGGWGMASSAIGVFLALVGFAQISEAQPQATVGEIANFCGASDDFSQDMCKYYVITMVGSIKVSQNFVHSKKMICIPDSVSEKEIVSRFLTAVKSDLKIHPRDADEPASAMIVTVAEASFPCQLQ